MRLLKSVCLLTIALGCDDGESVRCLDVETLDISTPIVAEALCLPRSLDRQAGLVQCEIDATMPPDVACASVEGYVFIEGVEVVPPSSDADGRLERCLIGQLPVTEEAALLGVAPSGDGWFYDNHTTGLSACSSAAQRIALTNEPPPGTSIRVSCRVESVGDGTEAADAGDPICKHDG